MTTSDRISFNEPNSASCRRSCLFQIALAVLVVANSAFASAADEDRVVVAPDPALQSAIARIVEASPGQQQQDALDGLADLAGPSHEQLVRQLVYFASRAQGTKEAMAAGVIIRRLNIPDLSIARALAPCVGADDPAVDKSVRNILGGLEKRSAGRRPDFSVYREIIADHVRAGEKLPDGLIRHMYDADAGVALLTLMRAHQLREPEDLKEILWAEHTVADVLWKQQYGFIGRDEIEPAAALELAKLSVHQEWWVRLYVSEIMRKHPAFRQQGLAEQLTSDNNQLVRESAAGISGRP